MSDLTKITSCIQHLIDTQQIAGGILNNSFVPKKFYQNQENIITRFLQQNNYIEYNLLES